MTDFLSDGWVEALDRAARADAGLPALTAGLDVVIEQVVTPDVDDPGGREARYHVVICDGAVSVRSGAADAPTVRFTQDRATALGIASGELSAQRAFMTGRLRVGGDLTVLLAHGEVLAQLDDVFSAVRAAAHLGSAGA